MNTVTANGRAAAHLDRTQFTTSRLLEFFTQKELTIQIGHPPHLWPLALVRELIDNALDACEGAGLPPAVRVEVEPDAVTIADRGPGLPPAVLERSLDYSVRISDKAHYVSPSRGQLGNALKCVWAAAYVTDGEQGRVEVVARGERHVIDVTLDRIAQVPQLQHQRSPADDLVKTGTSVRMHWPGIALLDGSEGHDFYNTARLLDAYATFNPQAAFDLESAEGPLRIPPSDSSWRKWSPSAPTGRRTATASPCSWRRRASTRCWSGTSLPTATAWPSCPPRA